MGKDCLLCSASNSISFDTYWKVPSGIVAVVLYFSLHCADQFFVGDTEFYSTKKGHHTINIIVVLSPKKQILYLSPSFPGIHLDKEITVFTKKEWHDKLWCEENGMGDAGFAGCREDGVRLDTIGALHARLTNTMRCRLLKKPFIFTQLI